MSHTPAWAWGALFLLGAYHGVNPAMGWLFAVALGLQKQSGCAVWQALAPIALGHLLAIGAVIFAAAILGAAVPLQLLRILVAILLTGFGIYRLVRKKHPAFGGMQVGFRDLATWSFLMAGAHGAGLMLLPVLLGMAGGGEHSAHVAGFPNATTQVLAVTIHTAGYLLVTGGVAWLVYTRLGVAVLRKAWVNLDIIWAVALIATAGLTLLSAWF